MARVEDVSDAWEENAGDWLAWTRTPEHDVFHLRFNFPQFTALLPAPSGRTVEIGCGEGRVGRWLAAHGHAVSGIDHSPTLAAAAREAGGYDEVVCGDAVALPWPDDTFELAVAYMVLHDMPDPAAAVGELSRVLRPGGCVAIAIIHPLNRPDEDLGRYFETLRFSDEVTTNGPRMAFNGVDRPLGHYTAALAEHGFVIERLAEPRPSEADCRADESLVKAFHRPYFLHLRCRLAG